MSIEKITKTIYRCRCEWPDCKHKWDAEKIPDRCAKCKRWSWNGVDRRRTSPHDKGPKIAASDPAKPTSKPKVSLNKNKHRQPPTKKTKA
jgi:hypothetical protein